MWLRNLILLCLFIIANGRKTRIQNGYDASPGEFKYQVSIQKFNTTYHFCGGAILNKEYVITAAHCTKQPYEIQVTTGLDVTKPDSIHRVVQIIRHQHYELRTNVINDIALLKVYPAFDFTKTEPVTLPKPGLQLQLGTEAVVTGWGSTTYPTRTYPDTLKKLRLRVLGNDECKSLYQTTANDIFSTNLCTRVISNVPRGACTGDSGGPLVMNKNVLIGIVSWSYKDGACGSPMYPNVYTRVTEYLDWIEEHIKPKEDYGFAFPID